MEVKRFINGPFEVNTYLVYDDKTSVVIDPGHEMSSLISFARENSLVPSAVLLTHAHIDHIAGIKEITKAFPGIETYIHEDDLDLLSHSSFQSKMFSLPDSGEITVEKQLADGEKISFGNLTFSCILTPGHSKGSLSYHIDNSVFTGDVIFMESVGRTDLFGGNHSDLIKAITERILTLPPETILYPGHGPATDVAHELKFNPYIN